MSNCLGSVARRSYSPRGSRLNSCICRGIENYFMVSKYWVSSLFSPICLLWMPLCAVNQRSGKVQQLNQFFYMSSIVTSSNTSHFLSVSKLQWRLNRERKKERKKKERKKKERKKKEKENERKKEKVFRMQVLSCSY